MKQNGLIFLFYVLFFGACTTDQVKIQFCTELTDQEIFGTTQDTFPT